ncbi:MAG: hypothetical protein KDA20_03890 [Phycisphaerales bacterium]|nr:hypothetical protein [Phycisphaerales bacterium]
MQDGTLAATMDATTESTARATSEAEAKPLPTATSAPSKPKQSKPAKRAAPKRDAFKPTPRDRLVFSLRPLMAGGADAIGDPSRAPLTPAEAIELLAQAVGVHGVTLTDDDLSPEAAIGIQLTKLRSDFKRAITKHKVKVAAITCDLAREGVFRDGALTSCDPEVRAYAVQKAMRALDLGAELGCKLMVFDLSREGADVMGSLDPSGARKWLHEALNFLCVYSKHKKYGFKFALRSQWPGVRRDRLWPTAAHHLVHIPALEHEDMVGVSFSFAAERAGGTTPHATLAQTIAEQRLYHVELDVRDGVSRDLFEAVRTLDDSNYEGFVHLDSGVMRTADAEGVAQGLANAMRQYLMLRAKARQWKGDPKIRGVKRSLNRTSKAYDPIERGFTVAGAETLLMRSFDTTKMREQALPFAQLEARGSEIIAG